MRLPPERAALSPRVCTKGNANFTEHSWHRSSSERGERQLRIARQRSKLLAHGAPNSLSESPRKHLGRSSVVGEVRSARASTPPFAKSAAVTRNRACSPSGQAGEQRFRLAHLARHAQAAVHLDGSAEVCARVVFVALALSQEAQEVVDGATIRKRGHQRVAPCERQKLLVDEAHSGLVAELGVDPRQPGEHAQVAV